MPRRADGVWVDKNGNVVYRTDPNDSGVDRSQATYKDGFWIDNKTGQKIPNKNDLPESRWVDSGDGGHRENTWPDGTPVTPEELGEINKQAGSTGTDPGWLDVVLGVLTGGVSTAASGAGAGWAGSPGDEHKSDPSPGAPNYHATGFNDPGDTVKNWLPPTAPGAELPTAQADADRQRMADYLAKLQGQAATGSGAWEDQLARATQQGTASATALGQSAAGVDPMAQRRNIGNATAGVEQRAAGQAETLRAQTQQQAQEQLAGIYSAQGSLDAQQAAEQAAARQGRREANQAITDKANSINQGIYGGIGGAVLSLLSNGGPVPGKAKVFGDDSANDTVPAMLSPGEIVLPRSVTHAENPEAASAAFVRAVKEHRGTQCYDDGGQVPQDPWATKPDTNAGDALPELANDPTVTQAGNAPFLGIGTPQQAAGVRNGGLLDTTAYNASRDQTLGATKAFLDAYAGRGPSVAPQQLRSATDANIAEALSAQANTRGAGRGAAAGLISGRAAEVGSEQGGKTAATAAEEATRGGQSYAAAIQRQRQMDLAFALAQQQAAWRNSMLNAGIGLAAQAQMRGVLGGVGQAFAAGAGALDKEFWKQNLDSNSGDSGSDPWASDSTPSEAGDWGGGDGWGDSGGDTPSWASDSDTAYAAHGGEIRDRDRDFARAYADGGEVSWTDRTKKALSMAVPILSGSASPWAGARDVVSGVGDQMRGQLEDEAIMRAQPDPRYSPEQAFDIETQNPVKLAALNRLSMNAATMPGAISRVGKAAGKAAKFFHPEHTEMEFISNDGFKNKLQSPYPPPTEEFKDLAKKLADEYDFEKFGVRVTDRLPEEGGTIGPSRVYANGELTGELVDGTSTIDLAKRDALNNLGQYEGRYAVLLGSDSHSVGEDFGEAVLRKPQALAAWDRETGKRIYGFLEGEIPDVEPQGFADGGEVDSLDAGTELSGPRDVGALQAPPFAPAVRPPRPLPVAAPLAPPPAGLPMAQPRPRPQAQMQATPAEPSAFELEKQAETAKTSALEELGRAQAEILVGQQKTLEQAAIDRQEKQARARMDADADMARILEARQAVSSISDTVDPGRWWASRSTPGKIAAAIGLALGAIGAGNDGVNRAVGIIENAIGRDLEAQKAEHQIRMRKGQMAVDSATSIYTLKRQLAQDDIMASDASVATALQIAKNQAEIATARASSPLAKAQGQALIAQLSQKRDAFDAATKQHAFDNYIKREDMETRRIAAQRERASQVGRDFVAPGYKLQPGAAPKVEELGKWRDALAEKRNTDVATRRLKELIDKSSFVPGSAESAQAQSLISDLKVSYKNMATLGALSGSDYALIDAAIPDPTSLKGHFTPDKTLKSRLDQFAKTAENKLNNKASVLGIVKDEGGGSGGGDVAGAKAWLEANPNSPKADAVRAKLRQMGAL